MSPRPGIATDTGTPPASIGTPASSASLTRSMRRMASPLPPAVEPSVPIARPFATISVPDAGRLVAGDDQHAAARRAAMLHARHHLLADIAALAEADATHLVEQHIVREGIAQSIVRPALGDAVRDAEGMPCFCVAAAGSCLIRPPGRRRLREARIAQPA